ncbi:patatin-like phospholipase family protein [Mesorhizobium sp. L-8-10]|uniref:patatin-like phospholipase family protein n=1 Tax=Mesorhizobium sp. L-8-10 TaxID=2744523 RepID=UPI001FD527B5|nr:patatin-like phospholipase family protein [Mesorhizobium sp. L-8-10]
MQSTTDTGPSETQLADSVAGFGWDGNMLEPGIALAMSGGGFRAMLFHAGALMRLNELGVLSKVRRVSSVSGGSISAGHLAAVWRGLGRPDANGVFAEFKVKYVAPILAFSRNDLDVKNALVGLLPGFSAASQGRKAMRGTCSAHGRCRTFRTIRTSYSVRPICRPAFCFASPSPMRATT